VAFLDPLGDPIASPTQGQAILYLGPNGDKFKKVFREFGFVLAAGEPLDMASDAGEPSAVSTETESHSGLTDLIPKFPGAIPECAVMIGGSP
jgi:hypothetical protein